MRTFSWLCALGVTFFFFSSMYAMNKEINFEQEKAVRNKRRSSTPCFVLSKRLEKKTNGAKRLCLCAKEVMDSQGQVTYCRKVLILDSAQNDIKKLKTAIEKLSDQKNFFDLEKLKIQVQTVLKDDKDVKKSVRFAITKFLCVKNIEKLGDDLKTLALELEKKILHELNKRCLVS